MLIRDDRGNGAWQRGRSPLMNQERFGIFARRADAHDPRYSPDRVLHDCPDCGRAHFVTVDGCPGAAEAAAEVRMMPAPKPAPAVPPSK